MDTSQTSSADNCIQLENLYISQLTEKEKKAYEIAKDHLGMSFQLSKSNGYLKWLKHHALEDH